MEYQGTGVEWLDRSINRAMDSEEVQQSFSSVSDSLGPLVLGHYDSPIKQAVILRLLGPAFVCKHFRQDPGVIRHMRTLERAQHADIPTENGKFSATFTKIRSNLENLGSMAMQRSFPAGRVREEVRLTVAGIISSSLLAATSIHRPAVHTDSSRLLLDDQENEEDIQSLLSNSIAAMIELDSKERFDLHLLEKAKETFARRYLGIPSGLRKTIWDSYLQSENVTMSEEIIRMSCNLKKVVPQTANNVIEMFHSWPGLRDFEDKLGYFQLTITKVLSHFYQDQSSSVFWLVPLLYTYGHNPVVDSEDQKFHVMLGLKMMSVTEKCSLQREEIFSLVEEIFTELKDGDPEYYQHLEQLTKDVHSIHQKDFDKEMIDLNDHKCTKIVKSLKKSGGAVTEEILDVFSDCGRMYVRQWLQTGFVNVLNKECLLYCWDILFLKDWSKGTVKIIAMSIILLLRFWMFRGRSYRAMRSTFLREPFQIYLLDLRKAVKHLSSQGKIRDCPESTNWKVKVVPPKPYWKEIQIRRDSLIKKIEKKQPHSLDVIGIIKSNFQRQDSVSSVESLEQVDAEPWLELWKPYSEDHDKSLPVKLPRLTGTFDLYIDGIRFLPQSISVAKISGNIFNLEMDLGGSQQIPNFPLDFDCCPDLKSFARFPSFHFRLPINRKRHMLNPNAILYIKIFGYEEHSGTVVLVGTTMFNLFKQTKGSPLNYGGHQLQCRRGTPDLSLDKVEHLHVADIDNLDRVPALTVLLRLLNAADDYQTAPWYENGFYKSHYCEPNSTDILFYKSYYLAEGFNTRSVKKNVISVRNRNKLQLDDLSQFFKAEFSLLNDNLLIDPLRFQPYSESVGLRLRLERMFGLPSKWDSRYYQGLVELQDISVQNNQLPRFLSQNYVMGSQLRSPEWEDQSHLMLVPQSDSIIALVRFYSFKPEYTASWEKEPEGRLGGNLDIDVKTPDGWSLCPLFSGGQLRSGYHHLPLFRGDVPHDVIRGLKQSGCSAETLKALLEDKIIKPISKERGNAVLVMKVLDGHFTDKTWWNSSSSGQEFHHHDLLEAVGGRTSSCLEIHHNGRVWQDFILDSLPQKEEINFTRLVQRRFLKELNSSLRDADRKVVVKNEIGNKLN